MDRALDLMWKISLVLLTFFIVVYVLIASKFIAGDIQREYILLGDVQTVIIITAGVFVLGLVLKKLLVWEIHTTLGGKRRKK